ncbi:hypothetical protein H6G89_28260 [Oscillatoria sp. FACHB-1407]|uniref:hypothetical protein n=1 Tax=Oscillatoria sp. FACHB-1407 TaxID=2692847 RepID=UPI001683DA41|nr:hypothetical protein [Oscillatoria sp. FACHB-1407]MBD2464902.1 hypothetical protein [Oscillatoria sp. FACHB-1407]
MTTLTDDEIALIKSLLIALRGIKTQDLDKALAILSKENRLKPLARREDEE